MASFVAVSDDITEGVDILCHTDATHSNLLNLVGSRGTRVQENTRFVNNVNNEYTGVKSTNVSHNEHK